MFPPYRQFRHYHHGLGLWCHYYLRFLYSLLKIEVDLCFKFNLKETLDIKDFLKETTDALKLRFNCIFLIFFGALFIIREHVLDVILQLVLYIFQMLYSIQHLAYYITEHFLYSTGLIFYPHQSVITNLNCILYLNDQPVELKYHILYHVMYLLATSL